MFSLSKYIASKLKALQTAESAAVQTQSGAKQCNAVQSGAVCPGQSAFCVSCITVLHHSAVLAASLWPV